MVSDHVNACAWREPEVIGAMARMPLRCSCFWRVEIGIKWDHPGVAARKSFRILVEVWGRGGEESPRSRVIAVIGEPKRGKSSPGMFPLNPLDSGMTGKGDAVIGKAAVPESGD